MKMKSQYPKMLIISLPKSIFSLMFVCMLISGLSFAEDKSQDGIWLKNQTSPIVNSNRQQASKETKLNLKLKNAIELEADIEVLRESLQDAPKIYERDAGQAGATIYLPLADGTFTSFQVYETQLEVH